MNKFFSEGSQEKLGGLKQIKDILDVKPTAEELA
jgi:hypothetical protein